MDIFIKIYRQEGRKVW